MSPKMYTLLTTTAVCRKLLLSQANNPSFQHSLFGPTTQRNLTTHALSNSMTLLTHNSAKHLKNRPDLSNYSCQGRPLSVLLCWLMAKDKAIKNYAKLYLDQGYDVLTVRISAPQFILPARVEPIVKSGLIPTLLSSDHQTKVIHGFSVGGYIFTRVLKHLEGHPQKETLLSTIKGQIWDSVVDINGAIPGISKSVFDQNETLEKILANYVRFHLKAFHNISTKYYLESRNIFYNQPLSAPALFLGSLTDPVSTIDVVEQIQGTWREKGVSCEDKIWKDSVHVQHLRHHPEEYNRILGQFLNKIGVFVPQHIAETPLESVNAIRRNPKDQRIPNIQYQT